MRQVFLRRGTGDRLLLFFGGWGTDECLLDMPLPADGTDVMLCYDYRTPEFDASPLAGYRGIRLVAWSMGVWVAGRLLGGMPLPWECRVAFNGTPYPIDDAKGIPEGIFRGTLDNFSDTVLAKFRRRMCADGEGLRNFMEHVPRRGTGELREELQALYDAVRQPSAHVPLQWDVAIVGLRDRIFPIANQLAAWQGVASVRTVDTAHYDADLIRQLTMESDLWTRN